MFQTQNKCINKSLFYVTCRVAIPKGAKMVKLLLLAGHPTGVNDTCVFQWLTLGFLNKVAKHLI